MIATKERKERKDKNLDLCAPCVLSQRMFSRGVLVNGALWLVVLLAAWVLYPKNGTQTHGFAALKIAVLLAWGIGAFTLAVRRGYTAWVGWPVALAGLLALQYVEVTPPSVRQHDVDGHREYVEYLIAKRSLPPVQPGWETWQPPLYYVGAALWHWLFSGLAFADPFRPVQFFAAVLYLAAIVVGFLGLQRLGFNDLETAGTLGLLVLLPGNVFFAARINNDVLLPALGAVLLVVLAEFVRTGARCWLRWLAVTLAALLATKGSSLAVVGGALALVFWVEFRRTDWRRALWPAYLTGLPAAAWQLFWWARTAAQTGTPFYVNAALPDNLLIHTPGWQRLLSFDFGAFLGGGFYYDEPIRQSYPTAVVTSMLYGEYGMRDGFRRPELLRWGCLGILLLMVAGAFVRPRPELRPAWITCLILAGCQTIITVTYAVQFPYACNQNLRFFAPAFVPFCALFGLGLGHFWQRGGSWARLALAVMLAAWVVGLSDFYWCVLAGSPG